MLTVAVDTGPLYGPMTGVGRAVSGVLSEFRRRPTDIEVLPYVVSRRARLDPGTRRLPYPAAVAMVAWSRTGLPRADRHVGDADIVHGMNYVVPPTRRPRVVSIYDTWSLRHPESSSSVVNRAMKVLERNIRSGAVVHASSQATADDVRELFPSAIVHVAHLGAPQPVVRGHADSDRRGTGPVAVEGAPFILTVGTVERRKNLPRFVEAFARIHTRHPDLHLVIAGSFGNDIDVLRSTIDRLESTASSRIVLLGRVDEEMLDSLYSQARFVAYPSLDEGFGFPILEGMAHGVPVLAATRGSIPEIAGDAAMLVDPVDIDSMSQGIDRLMDDDVLRSELIARGFERCRHFPWGRTADSLIDLYRTLVSTRDAF